MNSSLPFGEFIEKNISIKGYLKCITINWVIEGYTE